MANEKELLLARIAELEAKLATGAPLVSEGIFVDPKGNKRRTFRISVPGKMPFNLGEAKVHAVLRKDVQAALTELISKPLPFDAKLEG